MIATTAALVAQPLQAQARTLARARALGLGIRNHIMEPRIWSLFRVIRWLLKHFKVDFMIREYYTKKQKKKCGK